MALPCPAPTLSISRLDELLGRMRGRKLVVLGDAMLDRYLIGDTERISPEAPVPVVTVVERRHGPGGAANVAANVVALGGEARLVSVVGRDRDGETLRASLASAGISDRHLLDVPGRPTTCKTRVVCRGQQVVRIDEEVDTPLGQADMERLAALAAEAIAGAEALLLVDYDKGVLSPPLIRLVMAAARAAGVPAVVDPKFRCFFEYAGATVFKPNRRELAGALGAAVDLARADSLAAVVTRLGVEHLLLTLGGEGMMLASLGGGTPTHIPAIRREMIDVSGAGDTVTAWTGAALAAGATVLEAALVANAAAAVEVARAGVTTVSPEEVRQVLAAHLASSGGSA